MSGPLPNLFPTISSPLSGARLVMLSHGLGVESTALQKMAEAGLIAGRKPDVALTIDTGDERTSAHENFQFLNSPNVRGCVPLEMVSGGNLAKDIDDATAGKIKRFPNPPFFIKRPDGSRGMLNRSCTRDYKIAPSNREIRKRLGLGPRSRLPKEPVVELWIGISIDEIDRIQVSPWPHIYYRHPLVEAGWGRADCDQFLWDTLGIKVAGSGCVDCPFTDNQQWLYMKENYPADFERACQTDERIRRNLPGVTGGEAYIHDSLRPLRSIDFRAEITAKQGGLFPPTFSNMCGGACRT